jgi:hypothetical protein
VEATAIPARATCELAIVIRQGLMTMAGGWRIASGRANWYIASLPGLPVGRPRHRVASGSKILVKGSDLGGPPGVGDYPIGKVEVIVPRVRWLLDQPGSVRCQTVR